jgi:peptidoglycan/LPS O-acetylase OafA/YrhL
MHPIFDAIRATAALMVLVGHALSIFNARHPVWPQQFGVVIFFLLSGYLISQTIHKRLEQPQSTFLDYAVDRGARIYSGFLPAILFVVVLDYLTLRYFGHIAKAEVVTRLNSETFFANLFMLQAPGFFDPFGSAAPFWTVAIEFWIYMFVGLLAFAIRDGMSPLKIAAIAAAGIIPVQSFYDGNMVLIAWLAGAAVERVISSGVMRRVPTAICMLLSAALSVKIVFLVRAGERIYSWEMYLLCSAIFLLLIPVCLRIGWKAESPSGIAVAWWASWSYSLYLLHHTIFLDYFMIFEGGGPNMCVATAITIAVTILFARYTEQHHRFLGATLKRWLAGPTSPRVVE